MARRKSLLLLGVAAVAAGVLLKRDKVAGLLPGRGQTYEPPTPHTPGPSNYDAPGPVANTATPVPAPEPLQPEAIDEAAEEAAAAAEAANIGGVVSDYAGPTDLPADEAERPLAEAGEGESEGQEQAEAALRSAAEPTAPGMSDEQRQIEDAIDEAANPLAGEQIEGLAPSEDPLRDEDEQPTQAWSPPVPERTDDPAPFEPTEEQGEQTQFEPPAADDDSKKDDEGGSDWRTWSGRSINP